MCEPIATGRLDLYRAYIACSSFLHGHCPLHPHRPGTIIHSVVPCLGCLQQADGPPLDPVEGIELTAKCILAFLKRHMPLSQQQRHMLDDSLRPPDSPSSRGKKGKAGKSKGGDSSSKGVAVVEASAGMGRQAQARVGTEDEAEMRAIAKGQLFKIQLAA